jgi:protein SCO1/2
MKTSTTLIIGAALMIGLIAAGIAISAAGDHEFHGTVYANPEIAPEIVIHHEEGIYRLSEQRGKVVLLFFGYTSCPDICPATLSDMKQVHAALGDLAEKLQVVFVTVDPERDTAEKMGSYLSLFNPEFIGLTGDEQDLMSIWQGYGVFREIDNSSESMAGYLVNHSTRVYLIDPDGRLFITYSFGTSVEEITEDVRHILKSSG